MCGIFGVIVDKEINLSEELILGLKKLEYRGYDSAGIGIIKNNELLIKKAEGKINNLSQKIKESPIFAKVGIAHTRWATHGEPTEVNAHPHAHENIAVVHNGIIENYYELKRELQAKGYIFKSETDSEVVPFLLYELSKKTDNFLEAISQLLKRLEGAYSLGIIKLGAPKIYAVKNGAPLIIGQGSSSNFVSSDVYALAGKVDRVIYPEDGSIIEISETEINIFNQKLTKQIVKTTPLLINAHQVEKNGFETFMLKEIFEQNETSKVCISNYFDFSHTNINLPQAPKVLVNNLDYITIVACGTSYYAANVARYWFEKIAKVNVIVEIASEYRYRKIAFKENNIAIFISQSGETKDTLAALEYAKENNQFIMAIVNVVESSIAHIADVVLPIYAGPEIGVASTKAFTNQVITLLALCLLIAKHKNIQIKEYLHLINNLTSNFEKILSINNKIEQVVKLFCNSSSLLYIARGILYPIALESALKLKELSYIHAEAIPAGELKHGSIALIDDSLPIIVYNSSHLADYQKTNASIQEVIARNGQVILIGDIEAINLFEGKLKASVEIPQFDEISYPFIYGIVGQLLAYYTAKSLNRDIDQPRNLAKSVTVE
ncbi:glutamine--fructose-6-phosphate transaminase (isomerizing) [Rickettsiales endosymbiont of Stachyamoeba lipophora]|uniref:glutamine--fructose-6-phosphate transaminase (isomerizing) n=1 Tax=Rickettsiales endosymbiont of Stachyamoeba lipophora TaxID=2486578 RepID=UPI000F653E3B|nr:glutamine--fructose-6-phosphate transaminase (isomerizing) [Rickettsiales endosymbiont of Stachyamoeba lipophora]AZL15602.1 glutamine--fructose-6-phosphate transaminase (isomerizing) [Rickettsiales endosymbiont of Stachyamoeba lipophora]